jgi:PadR family transcriptional regulator PadR
MRHLDAGDRQAVDYPDRPMAFGAHATGPGTQDPLVGDLRRAGLLPLLVLHFAARGRCYGNMLMERIAALTRGALAVNPNTMYPLLRTLEAKGLIEGEWEHPERRSRRFYTITPSGEQERRRLMGELAPRLERIQGSIQAIRSELDALDGYPT